MALSRRDFMRDAFSAAAFTGLAGGEGFSSTSSTAFAEEAAYTQLVSANDAALPSLLGRLGTPAVTANPRGLAALIAALVGAYCAPESSHFKSQSLLAPMEDAAVTLLSVQHPDGTIDSGNYNSPPDTGFVVQTVCPALTVLRRANATALSAIDGKLARFLLQAGDALTTGGVHTPNHRWVISSALAQLNALFPSGKYVARLDDWLGEGIYCDADGQFSERSTGIYSSVVTNALITLARLLHRPELLEPVRRNLAMNMLYMHPNGELETVGSRRQDEMMTAWISNYYLQYRYMAIHDNNRQFAAVTQLIEAMGRDHAEARLPLIQFLEEPLYRRPLPLPEPVPTNYAHVFSNTALARIRRNDVSATIYGGCDHLGVASGLASNPTFFNFRKGQAVLESVRVIPDFFSAGAFRSEGLQADGEHYALHQRLSVPYYQPLPRHLRNAKGDYALTSAGDRYWSKMNFAQRPTSNIQTLDQRVTIMEKAGGFELSFEIQGHDRVPVAIELTFREGGILAGTEPLASMPGVHLLRTGTGRYSVGSDSISFGPGQADHEAIPAAKPYFDPYVGMYPPGSQRVYITAFTPIHRRLTFA